MFSSLKSWYHSRQFEQSVLDYESSTDSLSGNSALERIRAQLCANPQLVLHEMPGNNRIPLTVAIEGGVIELVELLLDVIFKKKTNTRFLNHD